MDNFTFEVWKHTDYDLRDHYYVVKLRPCEPWTIAVTMLNGDTGSDGKAQSKTFTYDNALAGYMEVYLSTAHFFEGKSFTAFTPISEIPLFEVDEAMCFLDGEFAGEFDEEAADLNQSRYEYTVLTQEQFWQIAQ